MKSGETNEPMTPEPARVAIGSRLDQQVAGLMFWASVLYLLVLSMLLHLSDGRLDTPIGRGSVAALAIIWLAFPLEYLLQRISGANLRSSHLWAAVLPWMRVAVRDHGKGEHLWFPVWGWIVVNRDLEQRLHQAFALPMMGVAIFVLPLVSIEYIWSDAIVANRFWQQVIQAATGLIWTAFALEFILMMAVVKYKWSYLKRHWIDLIVVLLPLVSFLPALRLARLARLNQLGRTVRLYRVRGLLMRTWRAIVALEVIDRLIWRKPESRLQRMQLLRFEMQRELDLMDAKIAAYCEKYRLEHPRGEPGLVDPNSDQKNAKTGVGDECSGVTSGATSGAALSVPTSGTTKRSAHASADTQAHVLGSSEVVSETAQGNHDLGTTARTPQSAHVIRLTPAASNRELPGTAASSPDKRLDHVA